MSDLVSDGSGWIRPSGTACLGSALALSAPRSQGTARGNGGFRSDRRRLSTLLGPGIVSAPPAPAAAAGHGQTRVRQCAVQAGREHLVQGSAKKGGHANPGLGDAKLQRCRDRPADQQLHAASNQFAYPCGRLLPHQRCLLALRHAAVFQVGQQQMSGDIEDRCNASLPMWNSDSHHTRGMHLTGQNLQRARRQKFTWG